MLTWLYVRQGCYKSRSMENSVPGLGLAKDRRSWGSECGTLHYLRDPCPLSKGSPLPGIGHLLFTSIGFMVAYEYIK